MTQQHKQTIKTITMGWGKQYPNFALWFSIEVKIEQQLAT